MNKLSSSQSSYLRSQAHHLEPIVLIGKKGVTNGTIETVNKALDARELIKIKFREYKEEFFFTEEIASSVKCHIVAMIGHTVILFRQNPDPELQHVQLP